MKKRYYFLSLILVMSFVSCEDYLEPKPTDFLNPQNYYQTEAELDMAKASAYNSLGAFNMYSWRMNYLYGLEADLAYMSNAGFTTGPFNHFYNSGDTWTLSWWTDLWTAVNRCNVVLDNIDNNPELKQEKRDMVRGEVQFLRGYYYFLLVQYWGGVPLKLHATNDIINVDIPRNTVKEVYTQILSDMEYAEKVVPEIQSLGYGGAVSKSAVRGILARVNLTMAGEPLKETARFTEARKWAKMVMDDTEAGHELNPSYPQVFINLTSDKYDIKESIWEVEFFGNRSDQYVENSNIGYVNSLTCGNSLTGGASSYIGTTSKYYNLYEPGDNRKWWNIPSFKYTVTSPLVAGSKEMIALPATEDAKNRMQPAKYRREYETRTPKHAYYTPNNAPILRYADVLLMFAEAETEVNGGPTPAAIDAVNKVRQRAWSTGIKSITVTNGGSGYTSAPSVTISGGGGKGGATATATIANGTVTAITLDRDLTGVKFYSEGDYNSVPDITISGGDGTGAMAATDIYHKIDANLSAAHTESKESFLALIQDERGRELTQEYQRKADLLRWGIYLEVNKEMGQLFEQTSPGFFIGKNYSNATEKDLLMPIPASEMTTNLKMTQNPGWD